MLFDPVTIVSSTIAGTKSLLGYIAMPIMVLKFAVTAFLVGFSVVVSIVIHRGIKKGGQILTKK